MNQRLANRINSIAVSSYKFMGSVLLGLILLGLLSFLSVHGFFLFSRSWLTPTIVSPTDPQILLLNTQAAQQESRRDELRARRREVTDQLVDAERTIHAERSFQQRFQVALKSERDARARMAQRLGVLHQEYRRTQQDIEEANRAFAGLSRTRSEALLTAKLLDREDKLTINHHLAQMAQSNLTLAQTSVELETRVETLQREMQGLSAAQNGLGKDAVQEGLTTDTLLLEREFTHSVLEEARAEATHKSLERDMQGLDDATARFEKLLETLKSSPYLKAIEQNLTIGFVPYENIHNAEPGTPLYACAAKVIWCREVGVVGPVLEGEVTIKHPIRQYMLRGVMVELELKDAPSAREDLLHLGRPPLLF
ncbi:hypothetical protein JGU66_18890 [Myxococcaceae bacterium JPH2]|nr:hypothetical protein [Myxococcaceae bacterium JPH2]